MPMIVRLASALPGVRIAAAVRARRIRPTGLRTSWDVVKDFEQEPIKATVDVAEPRTARVVAASDLAATARCAPGLPPGRPDEVGQRGRPGRVRRDLHDGLGRAASGRRRSVQRPAVRSIASTTRGPGTVSRSSEQDVQAAVPDRRQRRKRVPYRPARARNSVGGPSGRFTQLDDHFRRACEELFARHLDVLPHHVGEHVVAPATSRCRGGTDAAAGIDAAQRAGLAAEDQRRLRARPAGDAWADPRDAGSMPSPRSARGRVADAVAEIADRLVISARPAWR